MIAKSAVIASIAAACPLMAFGAPTQWLTENGGNGHYYEVRVAQPRISWFDARDQAVALGGYLATLTSPEENQFVWDALKIGSTDAYWADFYDGPLFGGFRTSENDPWQWSSGEPWGYSNFAWGSTTGFVATQFIAHTSGWDDVAPFGGGAGGNVSYIVEYNVPAPASGMILVLSGLAAGRRRRA